MERRQRPADGRGREPRAHERIRGDVEVVVQVDERVVPDLSVDRRGRNDEKDAHHGDAPCIARRGARGGLGDRAGASTGAPRRAARPRSPRTPARPGGPGRGRRDEPGCSRGREPPAHKSEAYTTAAFTTCTGGSAPKSRSNFSPPSRPIQTCPV